MRTLPVANGNGRLNLGKLMHSLPSEQSYNARILITITFHFDPNRLCLLAEVMRSLAEFPVGILDAVVVTNTALEDDVTLIHRLCVEALSHERSRSAVSQNCL